MILNTTCIYKHFVMLSMFSIENHGAKKKKQQIVSFFFFSLRM